MNSNTKPGLLNSVTGAFSGLFGKKNNSSLNSGVPAANAVVMGGRRKKTQRKHKKSRKHRKATKRSKKH